VKGIKINTNGLLLTEDIVSFCNDNRIHLTIAMHDYRLLAIPLIINVSSKELRLIVSIDHDFAKDVEDIYRRFGNKVSVALDNRKHALASITEEQMDLFIERFDKVSAMAELTIPKKHCDCAGRDRLTFEGNLIPFSDGQNGSALGCIQYRDGMKESVYHKLLTYVFKDSILPDVKSFHNYLMQLLRNKEVKRMTPITHGQAFLYKKILECVEET